MTSKEKPRLFATAGGMGALAGSLVGYSIGGSHIGPVPTILWSAWIGIGIGIAVAVAQNRHLHAEFALNPRAYMASVRCGLAGAVGGLSLFVIKKLLDEHIAAGHVIAWTVEGTLFGALLSPVLPNMRAKPASVAGAIAGALGGVVSLLLPKVVGYAVGVAVADSLKGVLVAGLLTGTEKVMLLRGAPSVAILWPTGESSTLLLGIDPICFGPGPECQVYIPATSPETPAVVARLYLRDSKIQLDTTKSGSTRELANGSVVNIGPLRLQIHH